MANNLSRKGTYKLTALKKSLPPLNDLQNDLLELLVEEWETTNAAGAELQKHINDTGSMMVVDNKGSLTSHPAFRIRQQSQNAYLKLCQQLRISLKNSEVIEDTDELDDLFS